MRDSTSRVFEHLVTASIMNFDQRVAYTQIILREAALNTYKAFLLECNQLAKYLTGDKCTLVELKGQSTYDFWTWAKSDGLAYDGGS